MTAPTTTPRRGPRARRRRRATALAPALVLALALGVAGCSEDGSGEESAGSGEPAAARLQAGDGTRTTLGRVTGRLSQERRERLRRDVGALLDTWLDKAYVGGEFPRADFEHAWPGFSSGAKDEARRDRYLTSNATIGRRIDGVGVRHRRVVLDVLAPGGRAAGVTAHVLLVFDTTGEVEARHRVSGDLYLSRREGAWQVFGYDMTRSRS